MTPLALPLGVPGLAPRGLGYPVHRGCGGALVLTEAAPPAWWTAHLPLVCALCHAGVDAPLDQVLRARDAALVERGVTSWPRVWCGGPAEPRGAPALSIEFDLETRSEANGRDRFARKARTEAAIAAVLDEVSVALAAGQRVPLLGPWCVRLTRLSPHRPLDPGNLWSAMKAAEDAVAHVLHVDDGSPLFAATVAQEKRPGPLAVRVEVWGGGACP